MQIPDRKVRQKMILKCIRIGDSNTHCYVQKTELPGAGTGAHWVKCFKSQKFLKRKMKLQNIPREGCCSVVPH